MAVFLRLVWVFWLALASAFAFCVAAVLHASCRFFVNAVDGSNAKSPASRSRIADTAFYS